MQVPTYQDIDNIQTIIDECKKDLVELYEEFDGLTNPMSSTYKTVETVRAANIVPLDPVTDVTQKITADLEPNPDVHANLPDSVNATVLDNTDVKVSQGITVNKADGANAKAAPDSMTI